jgi:hypothetical protein
MIRSSLSALALALALGARPGPQELEARLSARADLARHTWAVARSGELEVAVQTIGVAPPTSHARALAEDLAPRFEALRAAWGELAAELELPEPQRAPAFPALVVYGNDRAHQASVEAAASRAPFAEQAFLARGWPAGSRAPSRRGRDARPSRTSTPRAWPVRRASRSGACSRCRRRTTCGGRATPARRARGSTSARVPWAWAGRRPRRRWSASTPRRAPGATGWGRAATRAGARAGRRT